MKVHTRSKIPTSTADRIIDDIQYHDRVRAYDLHKHLGISRVTVHKHLRRLQVKGVLKKKGKPPLVEYILSNDSDTRDRKLQKIKERISPILQEAHIKKAALFGSFVRGDNTKESDIDILVDLPDTATLFDLVSIKQDLEEVLKKKVDVVEYQGIHPLIRKSILKHQYSLL